MPAGISVKIWVATDDSTAEMFCQVPQMELRNMERELERCRFPRLSWHLSSVPGSKTGKWRREERWGTCPHIRWETELAWSSFCFLFFLGGKAGKWKFRNLSSYLKYWTLCLFHSLSGFTRAIFIQSKIKSTGKVACMATSFFLSHRGLLWRPIFTCLFLPKEMLNSVFKGLYGIIKPAQHSRHSHLFLILL